MGMITVRVDEDTKVGDIVTIIGDKVSVKYTANFIGESPHTTITSINKNIPRIYKKNNKVIKEVEYD